MRKVLLFMAILLLAFGDVLGQAGRIRPPGKYMTGEPKVARKIYMLAVFQDGRWNEPVVQVIDNRRGKQAQKQDIRNASLLAEVRNLLSGFVPVRVAYRYDSNCSVGWEGYEQCETVMVPYSVYDGGGLQRVSREIGQAVYRILGGRAADEVLVRLRIKDPVEGDTWYSYLSVWQNVTGQVAGIKSSRIIGLVREGNEVHMIVYYTPRSGASDRLYVGEEIGYLPSPPAMGEFHASSIYVFLMRQMPDGEVQELERETFTHNGEYDGREEDFINEWVRSYYWRKKQNYRSLTGGFVYFVRPPEVNLQEFGVSDRRLIWKRVDRVCDGRVIEGTPQVEKYENNYTYSYNGIVQEADVYGFREVNGNLESTYMGVQELARSGQAGTYSFNKAVAGITAEQAQENVINPGIDRHDLISVQRIRELGADYVADLRNVYNVERVEEEGYELLEGTYNGTNRIPRSLCAYMLPDGNGVYRCYLRQYAQGCGSEVTIPAGLAVRVYFNAAMVDDFTLMLYDRFNVLWYYGGWCRRSCPGWASGWNMYVGGSHINRYLRAFDAGSCSNPPYAFCPTNPFYNCFAAWIRVRKTCE